MPPLLQTSTLHYTQRTAGKYRDLRQLAIRLPRGRGIRLSLNGQYRHTIAEGRTTKYANPGWFFGTNQVFVEWTNFYLTAWHLSFNVCRRGITLSYIKRNFWR